MPRPFLSLLLVLLAFHLHAQTPRLWGLTPSGGTYNKGTLFRLDADGTDFTVVHHFDELDGWGAEGTLCRASNGKLYGTTNLGGAGAPIAAGTLFCFDPVPETFTKLVDFNMSNGGYGWSGMMEASDGMLYGAGFAGGSGGSIYRVDPATDTYTVLYNLTQATDGGAIEDRLMQRADGLMFGVASQGGAFNAGTLFRFDPATSVFTKLHDFDGSAHGKTPYGVLCDAGDGWLYGTTWDGGSANKGIFYRYNPGTLTFEKLFDFTGPNGQTPWNGPLKEANDRLIGTVTLGGSGSSGLIYRYVPSTGAFTESFAFTLLNGGALFSSLLRGSDGQYYGMTNTGGLNLHGTIFSFDPANNTVFTLHSFFNGTDGYTPRGDLVEAGLATGVHEAQGIAFSVFPNPSTGTVQVRMDAAHAQRTTLRVLNSLGQVVQAASLTASLTELRIQAPGVYVVQLMDGEHLGMQKLVVE
ncbi:MAG: T9SS type A sorting domain-containing protein [Flavobacteriales bacterium]|nr:T9SS type A sorting domain-containing protein [Flavobacteriales bacterium]